jgi:hypothetical protein
VTEIHIAAEELCLNKIWAGKIKIVAKYKLILMSYVLVLVLLLNITIHSEDVRRYRAFLIAISGSKFLKNVII